MTAALAVYDIFQGQHVRKVDRKDGKVWRVLADCCTALGFSNSRMALRRIPKLHVNLIDMLAQDGFKRKLWVIDEVGLISLIAYSRLPKEQLDAFREVIGQRATAPPPDNVLAQAVADMAVILKQLTSDVAELKGIKEPVLLKPVIDYAGDVRVLLNDWIKVNKENPKVHHQSAHGRLNELFYYKHHRNINLIGKRTGRSALQVAIDLGKGREIWTLAQDLVENDFYGYFSEIKY